MKKVAIVILNWNGRKLMEEFLPSVVSNSPEWAEVIVADNGSTDDSIKMLKAKFPTVSIICLDQNYGFAEGYNQALKRLDHEYCVLLNSDVEVTPNWLDAPISTLDSDPSIACVQPKIRAQRNKEYFEYAGAAGGYIDKYGYPFCRGESCISWKRTRDNTTLPPISYGRQEPAYSFARLRIRKSGIGCRILRTSRGRSICVGVYVPGDIG